MSRLEVKMPAQTQAVIEQIYSSMERRIEANPPGLCPVDMTLNFLSLIVTTLNDGTFLRFMPEKQRISAVFGCIRL